LDRRTLLAATAVLAVWPALAQDAPPALAAYERETGGRIGLYVENLATGTKVAWRAEERFVMCSTFKASLAALVLTRIDLGQDQLEHMNPVRLRGHSRLVCAGGQAEPGQGGHVRR
jgi:beta-lactamase class A